MKWCYHGRRNDPNWVVRLRYSAPTDQTFHVEVWQDSESLLTKTQYETTSYRFLVKLCEVLNGECLPLQKVQVQRMANCEATKISCSFCLELTSHSTLSPTMMFCLGWCGAALKFGGSNFWILLSATSNKTLVKLEGTKFLIGLVTSSVSVLPTCVYLFLTDLWDQTDSIDQVGMSHNNDLKIEVTLNQSLLLSLQGRY